MTIDTPIRHRFVWKLAPDEFGELHRSEWFSKDLVGYSGVLSLSDICESDIPFGGFLENFFGLLPTKTVLDDYQIEVPTIKQSESILWSSADDSGIFL